MVIIDAAYATSSSITSNATGATAGAYKISGIKANYVFDGSKLYKLTVHDGTNGFYNECKPAYGTIVKYVSGTATTYKTWTAGTPSWQ